jgi:uncharacterized protein
MPVRAHGSHPYLDATRGSLSFARGPLVYCAEQQDNDAALDDVVVAPEASGEATLSATKLTPDAPAEAVTISLPATVAPARVRTLYPELRSGTESQTRARHQLTTVSLVPYYLWGNRDALAMRVWLRQQ